MKTQLAELKVKLERTLRQPVPQAAINKLVASGAIPDYFEGRLEPDRGEKDNFQCLKALVREELNFLREYRREISRKVVESSSNNVEGSPPMKLEMAHGSYVGKRAEVISEVWAALADDRPDVSEYRQTVLNGNSMSPEEATIVADAPEAALGELRALELDKLGSILANDYYGWDKEGAIWYVLTSEAPRMRPIRIRARGKAPVERYVPFQYDVTFSVLPWVPAEEVENAYRSVQRQLLERSQRKTAPRTSPRVLEVVQFWWKRFRTDGHGSSWRGICELWNGAHPDKKFKTWRAFRTYFIRGTKDAQPTYVRFPQPMPADGEQGACGADNYTVKTVQGYRNWALNDRYSDITFQ